LRYLHAARAGVDTLRPMLVVTGSTGRVGRLVRDPLRAPAIEAIAGLVSDLLPLRA
jgi:hypothetical protein